MNQSCAEIAGVTVSLDHWIDGRRVSSPERFSNASPIDGSDLGAVSAAGQAEADMAVEAASKAFPAWAALGPQGRLPILRRFAEGILARGKDIAAVESLDNGSLLMGNLHRMVPRAAQNISFFAEWALGLNDHVIDHEEVINNVRYDPSGVAALITPWNAPMMLTTWKVGPALACGNTVIVKPSEETPLTTTLLGEVMNKVGVPKGVYNVVHGLGPDSAGEYLTQHPLVNGITFTGETRTGEAIMRQAALGIRQVSFELGGKNPALIFADCDMDKAIEGTMRSVFANCGQVCLGTERVYVERPIFDEFVRRLKAGAEALKLGRPDDQSVNLGPLISLEHRDKVLSYYRKAVAEGATVVTGGGVPDMPGELAKGAWAQPTIWTGLADDAACVREEIFGPCCHIRPFDTEEEAIRLANDTPYGLAAAVWTENLSRAHRVAARMDVGVCWVNSWFLRDLRTAFGGAKASGIGREGGLHSLEFYTELSNVCIKL